MLPVQVRQGTFVPPSHSKTIGLVPIQINTILILKTLMYNTEYRLGYEAVSRVDLSKSGHMTATELPVAYY